MTVCTAYIISFNISGDDSVTPCLIVQSQSQHMLGSYVPQCTEDGKYTAQQCHPGTGYCWCVDANGVEVENTLRPPYERPVNCSEGQWPVLFLIVEPTSKEPMGPRVE